MIAHSAGSKGFALESNDVVIEEAEGVRSGRRKAWLETSFDRENR
jgi:hypothetical protein